MKIGHRTISAIVDGYIGTDCAYEYGEPGYELRNPDASVLLGDWWCHKKDCGYPETYDDGHVKIHSVEWHYPRLFAALEEQGYELEWLDEWYVDYETGKAWRTEANSYSWQSSIAWCESGEVLTPDDDIEAWMDEFVNNPRKALPTHVWTDEEICELGFEEYECGFENGWHPGQTDDPVKITEGIRERLGATVDILFKLSGVGQFDISWCVFVREGVNLDKEDEEDDEREGYGL